MTKIRVQRCIACGLMVEWENWAAGPVCYPCYYGAKLEYENGVTTIEQIPSDLQKMLESMFVKNGYTFPSALIESWRQKKYLKCNTMLRRWWHPTKEQEAQDDTQDAVESYQV